jgi:hypothetical protein
MALPKFIFVVYLPGYAGNFLQRVFSLSKEVTPVLTRQELADWIYSGVVPQKQIQDFNAVMCNYKSWQDFHDDYPGCHALGIYPRLLATLPFTTVVSQIHPHEYSQLYPSFIEKIPNKKYIYVTLDTIKYSNWLRTSQQKLKFELRMHEVEYGNLLETKMPTFNLTTALDSEDGFRNEYEKACDILGLSKETDNAVLMYRNWRQVRCEI